MPSIAAMSSDPSTDPHSAAFLNAQRDLISSRRPIITSTVPVEATFKTYFLACAIMLPGPAALGHLDGSLYARGWSVRWRWHSDGSLEFRAGNRMTNERWHVI